MKTFFNFLHDFVRNGYYNVTTSFGRKVKRMSSILSVSSLQPPYSLRQEETTEFARELFAESFHDIERLLNVFANGDIKERQFAVPLSWFRNEHSLKERNDLYIERATSYSVDVIKRCLSNRHFLKEDVDVEDIHAIFFISSTGMSTPSIDARVMNKLPFSIHTKRLPLWGLGCAGGAIGLSRAHDYCEAYPKENVLVVCVELCSLTFQKEDHSKSNLIGTSLFADGVACALVVGDESPLLVKQKNKTCPSIVATESIFMRDSEDVMGWDVKNAGLYVVFSRHIPSIIENVFKEYVENFLEKNRLQLEDISLFLAHPGGKKVLDAYKNSLKIEEEMLRYSKSVLSEHGNMSSPTVLYVLERAMIEDNKEDSFGLLVALGPGFCSELALLKWKGGK